MDILVNDLLQEALANVNITLVVALMALGFIVKHVSFLDKINNDLIPPVLLLFSIIVMVFTDGFTVASIVSAIVNAAVAVGLHQQGKNIFTVTIVPSIAKLFEGLVTNSTEYEESDEEESLTDDDLDEESVDEVIDDEEEDTDI